MSTQTIRAFTKSSGRYIPEGATVLKENELGVIYSYCRNNKIIAISYSGKRNKPDWHFSFRSEEDLKKRANDFFESLKRHQEYILKNRQERKNTPNKLQIGDYLKGSWGYDQINCEFYRVVAVKGKMVHIQKCSVQSVGNNRVRPTGETSGEVLKRLVVGESVRLHDYCSLSKWIYDPEGCYETPWYAGH